MMPKSKQNKVSLINHHSKLKKKKPVINKSSMWKEIWVSIFCLVMWLVSIINWINNPDSDSALGMYQLP